MVLLKIEKQQKAHKLINSVYLNVISPSGLENETILLRRHGIPVQGNCYAQRKTTCNVGKS